MSEWDACGLFIDDARSYDEVVQLVQPNYLQMHHLMHMVAVKSVSMLANNQDRPILALDIGSGTGEEGVPLLQELPRFRLIGVDFSGPMNKIFAEKATNAGVTAARFHLIGTDIHQATAKTAIQDTASKVFGSSSFQIVLSALTFHSFSKEQRMRVFRMIYELLEPGGLFLFGDLFKYDESPWLNETIANWQIDLIGFSCEQAAKEAEQSGKTQRGVEIRQLKNKWTRHYQEHNLGGMMSQVNMLNNVGFKETASIFRYWQLGLIVAKK